MIICLKRCQWASVILCTIFFACFHSAARGVAGPGADNNFDGRRILLIGIDGVQRDALQTLIAQNRAPNMGALAATGTTYWNMEAGGRLYTPMEQPTLTGPGWASILTGVFQDKHGRPDNDSDWYLDGRFPEYPHFFKHIREVYPDAWLGSIAHATTPNNVLLRSGDGIADLVYTPTASEKSSGNGDVRVTEETVAVLQNEDPDALFIHFLSLDSAGHTYGYGKTIPQYMNVLETIDGHIGDILDALRSRPQFADEEWLIMVTTDHGGGLNKAHGSQSDDDRHIFGIFNGPGFAGGVVDNSLQYQTLFFPTVLRYLGIAVDPAWDTEDPPAESTLPYPEPVNGISISDLSRDVRHPKPSDAVKVSAVITGATLAHLWVAINDQAFTAMPLTHVGDNRWQVTIPPQADGTRVKYAIEAFSADTSTRLPFPLAPYHYYSYTVEEHKTDAADLVINEIMYDPTGSDNASRSEWIEVYNRRNTPVDVSHYWVADTVDTPEDFIIPEGTIIPAKGYLVLAGSRALFLNQYPAVANDPRAVIVDIKKAHTLNNNGDSPSIVHVNDYRWNDLKSEPFQHVPYTASAPWPANSAGGSIELKHPTLDVTDPANWALTTSSGGTPGRANSVVSAASGVGITSVSRNPEYPTSSDPVLITAQIKADSTVIGYVHSTIGSTNRVSPMARLDAETLQANLGTIPNGSIVSYHIEVAAGAVSTTWPAGAPANREMFRVDDQPAAPGDLVINELNYDPQGTDNGTNSEWFEIVNTTARTINVSHFSYSVRKDHIPSQFPAGTLIPAEGYLVVAGVKSLFESTNPGFPGDTVLIDAGWPSRTSVMTNSNNSNLLVRIQHMNAQPRNMWAPPPAVDEVPYRRTAYPWPGQLNPMPNSNGHTIELLHPSNDNTDGANWRVSHNPRGTPGAKNSVNSTPSAVRDWNLY